MKFKSLMFASLVSMCILGATSCGEVNSHISEEDNSNENVDKPGGEEGNKPGEGETDPSNPDKPDKPGEGETDPSNPDKPDKPGEGETDPDKPDKPGEGEGEKPESKYDLKKVSELIAIGDALENDTETAESYYCKGTIEKITDASKNAIIFKDASGSIFCYRVNGKTTIEPALKVGEELVLQGTIKKYKNKPQFNYPQIVERNVVVEPPLSEAECTPMTIKEAHDAEPGTKVKITGVVSIITKTQQFKDNGFYLIDETGSIYVHSNSLVAKVAKGNKITILCQRENYLGSSETNAHKQGYLGAIQVVKPVLVSNDNKTDNKYDTSWIKENTIKNIIDTPLSENITSEFYKVKTFVKKSSVNNNTILVLNDIDNYTGAIVYSCNKASDFQWLMPYDGKLVELYVAAHNVNVTETSYNYRFQPLEVVKTLDNYTLTDAEKADYVATYHVSKQFRNNYTSDPSLELMTTFSEDLWSINNATIQYKSDNENVVKIENNVMHCLNNGKANIEVTVKTNEAIATKSFAINVNKIDINNALTVKEAIDAQLNTEVLVKGIVASKVANKDAIYITDETGTIAISLQSAQDLKDLHIGDEVVFKGLREFKQKNPEYNGGQSVITGSVLLSNTYGNHPIPTTNYVQSTIKDIRALTEDIDHTTTVYTIKASVVVNKTAYSTNTVLKDGSDELLLYSGKESDYMWLKEFIDKGEIEAHVMVCDWNQKGLKGAVLSVTVDGTTTYNNNGLAN